MVNGRNMKLHYYTTIWNYYVEQGRKEKHNVRRSILHGGEKEKETFKKKKYLYKQWIKTQREELHVNYRVEVREI